MPQGAAVGAGCRRGLVLQRALPLRPVQAPPRFTLLASRCSPGVLLQLATRIHSTAQTPCRWRTCAALRTARCWALTRPSFASRTRRCVHSWLASLLQMAQSGSYALLCLLAEPPNGWLDRAASRHAPPAWRAQPVPAHQQLRRAIRPQRDVPHRLRPFCQFGVCRWGGVPNVLLPAVLEVQACLW